MTSSIAPITPVADPSANRATAPTVLPSPLARRVVGHALLLGVAGNALLGGAGAGLGFPVFVALAALTLVAATWAAGRDVPAEPRGWLATAVVFACAVAWRDSGTLEFFDGLAAVVSLGMAAVTLRDPAAGLRADRLGRALGAATRVLRAILVGIVPTAVAELFAPGPRDRWRSGPRPVARAALIGGSLLLVFGSLLRSADPIFASLVALPDVDAGEAVRNAVVVGAFAWVAGGWAIGALGEAGPHQRTAAAIPFSLGALDLGVALGTLTALFAAFVLTQLGALFGGEAFLRARTGLTAAEYARGGFFQMLLVVVLVLPLLVGTRAALAPGRALARRHTALSVPIVGLLGAIILSAVWRMRMYVHFYGLTTDRFYPLVFMGWLGLVLGWLAVTVLRDRGRPFAAGTAISGLATLFALNVAAPDAIVARVNVTRASRPAVDSTPALDLRHLASLSGEAADVAVAAVLRPSSGEPGTSMRRAGDGDRCAAAGELLARWASPEWSTERSGDPVRQWARWELRTGWRQWNAGDARARAIVERHADALWRVAIEACPRTTTRRGSGSR